GGRHPRPRRRTAVVPPHYGDEGGRGDRSRVDRPGAGRSARGLHPAAGVVDPAAMRNQMSTALTLSGVSKAFTMHLQGGVGLPMVNAVAFAVAAGECTVLAGPSGTGKSSILKMIFGTYRCDAGSIQVHQGDATVDVATAPPRRILALRRQVLGYVSQFLRA